MASQSFNKLKFYRTLYILMITSWHAALMFVFVMCRERASLCTEDRRAAIRITILKHTGSEIMWRTVRYTV